MYKNTICNGGEILMAKNHGNNAGVSSGIYGLAFIGAAIYYLQHATSIGSGAIGLLKALLWPAFLVYQLLAFLKM